MKKIMMTLAAVLCCAMTTTVFTACGDDDDDNTPKSSEILGIGGIYLISVDEKMAQLCDYTMTYYANDNKLMTEKAPWAIKDGKATWQKEANSINFPATFGVKISVKLKDGAQLADVHIDNVNLIDHEVYLEGITKDGKKAWGNTVKLGESISHRMDTSGEKLPQLIELWDSRGGMLNASFTFDKDGNQIGSGVIE